ncbi:MAG TPA: ABC transporter permease subunit [Candidatus Dormibacteraeota bacterium]|nr:ABC transporter permease subunit [Candidatus Dormibacteraeota bacterium]
MIATIKSEWRKNRFRPAFLVGSGIVAAITVLLYGVSWYQALNPGAARQPVSLLTLYPDQFVNNVMGAGFPLGAAIAIVLGALIAGSEYSWGTMKTSLTQGPGRITMWFGRVVAFEAWMGIITLILFVVGAASSVVVASFQGHTIAWPAIVDVAKGFGTIWLVFAVNGAIGMALGVLIRSSAAALGVGLIYVLAVEVIAVRFIDSISSGAYKWIGDLFVNQNATALTSSFTSPAFGRSLAPSIGAEQAVVVLFAYFAGLIIVAAALIRQRDVT